MFYLTFIFDHLISSYGQAIKISELSKKKQLNYNTLNEILSQTKGTQNAQTCFNEKNIGCY